MPRCPNQAASAVLVEPGSNDNTVQVFMSLPHVTGLAGDATPGLVDGDFFLIVACNSWTGLERAVATLSAPARLPQWQR